MDLWTTVNSVVFCELTLGHKYQFWPAGVCETDSDELVLKRKPLNNIVRRSRASHQLRCIIEELAAKVRLVVCGNWKKGATPHAPENQSLNRAEAIRIAASLLAQVELTCWCETWEATALEALVQALSSRRILDMEAMEL
eukprot:s237_g4.t2